MKEFQSTTGGRHIYNTDFKNLQELALAMQEIFHECGENFVISGCKVTDGDTLSVSDGYVYIDGKVRKVAAAEKLSATNLYIVAAQRNGDDIPYADGNYVEQYVEYYAEAQNNSSVSGQYIKYDSTTNAFPNLATTFFNFYSVCKQAGEQSINNLTVQKSLTASGTMTASQGVTFSTDGDGVFKDGNNIVLKIGDYSFVFTNGGGITIKKGDESLFTFLNNSVSETITYENIKVSQNLHTKKLYIDDIDIEDKISPLGTIQMWAGSVDKIPSSYLLCNGQAVKQEDYPLLYAAIGSTFNTAPNANGTAWSDVSSGMFRLPDLRGRFIVGYNPDDVDYTAITKVGGEKTHTLTEKEIPAHTHKYKDSYYIESSGAMNKDYVLGHMEPLGKSYDGSGGTDVDNNTILYRDGTTETYGSGESHENRPPYYVLAYIMRAK